MDKELKSLLQIGPDMCYRLGALSASTAENNKEKQLLNILLKLCHYETEHLFWVKSTYSFRHKRQF